MALRAICLFDGYGGFELGLKLALGADGIRTVARVERDTHAAATLVARMEDATLDRAPVWDDVCTFDGRPWRGRVDIITAGFNCQPFSAAGQRRGADDERWLWRDIARIVADVGPRLVFLENVPGLVRLGGLDRVCGDLADLGFDAEWGLLSASTVGASHRRQRFWLLAWRSVADAADNGPIHTRHTSQRRTDVTGDGRGPGGDCWPPPPDDRDGWDRWVAEGGPEPQVRRSAHGRPLGLAESLHLGGNGLVPRVAAEAFAALALRAGIATVKDAT